MFPSNQDWYVSHVCQAAEEDADNAVQGAIAEMAEQGNWTTKNRWYVDAVEPT